MAESPHPSNPFDILFRSSNFRSGGRQAGCLHHPFRVCAWIVFAGDYGCCAFVNQNTLDSAPILGGGGDGM